jgi:hypothetical protein
MNDSEVKRESLSNGAGMRLSAGDCSFVFERPQPGVLLVTITGYDKGQFGTETLDEIRAEISRERTIKLFVDASRAVGASPSVSDAWTRFFTLNREQLSRVYILVGSKMVHLTVAISQHLSQTGNLIQIYSDPEQFAGKLKSIQ